MRKNWTGRSLSLNPNRASVYDREARSAGPSDVRRTQIFKSKGSSQIENSQIPRPRIRSSSSERQSIHRKSNLKIPAPGHLSVGQRTSSVTPITPNAGRLHVGPPSATRHKSPSAERASIFTSKVPRKDSRPINEKFYQCSMLNKIDSYFAGINQSSMLNSNGSLKPPTLKMFIETTVCLLSLLDVKHNVGMNNYMEELPKIAKKLHYPGTVAKSWLKTANTMYSWPQVLAWLSWLVDVCEAKDVAACEFEIDKLPFNGIDKREEEKNRKFFFTFVKCYAAWNEESPEEMAYVEQLIHDLNDEHGDMDSEIAAAFANLEKERASYEAEDNRASDLDEKLSEMKRTLETLQQEDRRDSEYLNSLQDCIRRDQQEINHLEVNAKAMDEKIRKEEIEYDELRYLVENQTMSAEERDLINQRCFEIENNLQEYEKHIQDIEKDLFTLDLKFSTVNKNLYTAILTYNKEIITNLGSDIGVDLEELKMPEANMLSADFMQQLEDKCDAMTNVQDRVRKCLSETDVLIEQRSNELEALKDKLKILREEKKSHMEKMAERKINAQQMQRKANEMEVKLKEQMKNVEIEILQLQRSIPNVETAVEELKEARDKHDAVVRRQQFLEQSAERFFTKFYDIIAKHRHAVADLLKKIPKSKSRT